MINIYKAELNHLPCFRFVVIVLHADTHALPCRAIYSFLPGKAYSRSRSSCHVVLVK